MRDLTLLTAAISIPNNVEFETTWLEIKNKFSKNIVCGSVYKHPHNNFVDFLQYLELRLISLAKENKEIYIYVVTLILIY